MDIRILSIDDDEEIGKSLHELYNDIDYNEHSFKLEYETNFEAGIELIKRNDYDIVILDLCRGKATVSIDQPGYNVLREIQALAFIPVIFYSGKYCKS